MNIIKQASYNNKDYAIEGREHVFRGFIQVEKVSLRHRLFAQDSCTPVIQRELIHRPEAAGVLIYSHRLPHLVTHILLMPAYKSSGA